MSKTYVFFNSFFRLFSKFFLADFRHFLILKFQFYNYVENVRFRHNTNNGITGVEWGRKMNKNANFISRLKKTVFSLSIICCFWGAAIAQTETITWTVDGQTYATTSCESGDDVVLPNPPTKNGFTFAGWRGYTPIRYLGSSRTQYIDTGIFADFETFKIEIKAIKDTSYSLFGTGSGDRLCFTGSSGGNFFYYGSNTGGSYSPTSPNEPHVFVFNTGSLYVDGELKQPAVSVFVGTTSVSVYLFARNKYNSSDDAGSHKIYYCKIWNNNNLVRDFIPVLDEAGVACMFDRVTNQFFYNAGTGNFIAGPIVTE